MFQKAFLQIDISVSTVIPSAEYLQLCWRIWAKDELGIITYHEYDQATGQRVKSIQDVNTTKTSDFTNSVPSGWSTVSGAGNHLVTNFTYDVLGRLTESLAPQNTTINASNQSVITRAASWALFRFLSEKHLRQLVDLGLQLQNTLFQFVDSCRFDFQFGNTDFELSIFSK